MTKQTKPKKAPVKKSVAPKGKTIEQKDVWADWTNEVSKLSYDIFFGTEQGQRLLQMLETRFFYSPVANPGVERNAEYWAFHTDGHNDFIRKLRGWAQFHMSGATKSKSPKAVTRKRTSK